MPPTGNFPTKEMKRLVYKVIGERIVKEAEVVERELRQEEEINKYFA